MSRKGRAPIKVPKGVEVKVQNNNVTVKGPKGTLSLAVTETIALNQTGDELVVAVSDATRTGRRFHGLYRSLIQNMVDGVSTGFKKQLEMIGVGYRAAVQGHTLDLQIGCSHPTAMKIPDGIKATVEKNIITLEGHDKQRVGQFAAEVRAMKPPEPYQGKGIRYVGEYVRKKAGKAAKTAAK